MASLLTNKGKEITVNRLRGTGTEPNYLQWGTGTGATAASTALVTPANESRVAGTSAAATTTTTNDTYRVTGTITAGGARAITEVGLFDAAGTGNPATGGNMFAYSDFSVINLAINDSIAFTVDVKYA